MRFLFKISWPVEAGNEAAKGGFQLVEKILSKQKPEAAYFIAEGGMRTAILIMKMKDVSQLPAIAEPWFLALNARIEVTPAMVADDLKKAGPDIQRAVKSFGG
jgi:hypoxanthine phosphoribosyltransferase